jgi:hypothetical protein
MELLEELAKIIRDAQQSGEEVTGLRMQLADALTMVARVAPAALQTSEPRSQKFPNRSDFSSLHRI